jgi:hypothetical protein
MSSGKGNSIVSRQSLVASNSVVNQQVYLQTTDDGQQVYLQTTDDGQYLSANADQGVGVGLLLSTNPYTWTFKQPPTGPGMILTDGTTTLCSVSGLSIGSPYPVIYGTNTGSTFSGTDMCNMLPFQILQTSNDNWFSSPVAGNNILVNYSVGNGSFVPVKVIPASSTGSSLKKDMMSTKQVSAVNFGPKLTATIKGSDVDLKQSISTFNPITPTPSQQVCLQVYGGSYLVGCGETTCSTTSLATVSYQYPWTFQRSTTSPGMILTDGATILAGIPGCIFDLSNPVISGTNPLPSLVNPALMLSLQVSLIPGSPNYCLIVNGTQGPQMVYDGGYQITVIPLPIGSTISPWLGRTQSNVVGSSPQTAQPTTRLLPSPAVSPTRLLPPPAVPAGYQTSTDEKKKKKKHHHKKGCKKHHHKEKKSHKKH